ncbi:PREDICTED: gustatory and pheromone receptor 32a-like [Polistes dominula]|uniref:Gustatory and pheromone receptor 32a-like n=1 Tax=Polistes dominula TaxID=743375 RepID=A0ABM1JB57_POLDO|nr:PREDICTED: gustatory and pheromone receptor 32a-like [Polistes dominula]
MLTTTNNSPQHKRMIKMRNNWKNDSASADIHRIYESNENVVKIKIAQKLHLELMKCAKNINNAYSRRNINAIISLSYWIFIYMFKIIMISHLCATTSAEASNIGDIICELYIPTTSKEFRTEISDFTLQLIQNPLSFTCCGFFQLNHTLISKVIVSVTTYLVILIQVGNLPPQVFNDDLIS